MLQRGLDNAKQVSVPWGSAGGLDLLKDSFKEVRAIVEHTHERCVFLPCSCAACVQCYHAILEIM